MMVILFFVDQSTTDQRKQGDTLDNKIDSALDRLLVAFGKENLSIVPRRVSTEVDARFSFDKNASIDKPLHIIEVRNPPRK